MSTSSGSLSLDAARQSMDVLARHLDDFVAAWESAAADPPDLKPFLPERGEIRRLALVELIKVDLEYRWIARNCPRRLADYLAEFPELGQDGVPCDLIYEEFHIRRQSGQEVAADEYLQAYPGQSAEIAAILGIQTAYETSSFYHRRQQQKMDGIAVGDQIDDFDLLAELGSGAFAKVFLARQRSMQRLVALKVSCDQSTEPQTLAQLDHDYIVRVYDQRLLPERRLRLLYMQYIAGGTLQAVIYRVRQTPRKSVAASYCWMSSTTFWSSAASCVPRNHRCGNGWRRQPGRKRCAGSEPSSRVRSITRTVWACCTGT